MKYWKYFWHLSAIFCAMWVIYICVYVFVWNSVFNYCRIFTIFPFGFLATATGDTKTRKVHWKKSCHGHAIFSLQGNRAKFNASVSTDARCAAPAASAILGGGTLMTTALRVKENPGINSRWWKTKEGWATLNRSCALWLLRWFLHP